MSAVRVCLAVGLVVVVAATSVGAGNSASAGIRTSRQERAETSDWVALDSGDNHVCAIRASRRLYCWGEDDRGQLGNDAARVDVGSPVEVWGGTTDWASVSAGEAHTCGIKLSGRLYCWGSDGEGQVGNGSGTGSTPGNPGFPTPVLVAGGIADWAMVSASDGNPSGRQGHTCGVTESGRLYCWGSGVDGQLGVGSDTTGRVRPIRVGTGTNWSSVAASGYHTCARKTTGRLFCWGASALGAANVRQSFRPVEVAGGATNWTSVTVNAGFTCGRKSTGRLYCWGSDLRGRLGNGAAGLSNLPVQVAGSSADWARVSNGSVHACARKTNGDLFCWGDNLWGRLGDGTTVERQAPVRVVGSGSWSAVSGGFGHTCGIRDGRLACWGRNLVGGGIHTTPHEL